MQELKFKRTDRHQISERLQVWIRLAGLGSGAPAGTCPQDLLHGHGRSLLRKEISHN